MKRLYLILLALLGNLTVQAQTTLKLNIQHKFEKSNFAVGQPYLDANNQVIQISKVLYYLSSLELTHDGNQTVALSNKIILVDGTQSNYDLGTITPTIEILEAIDFDLGIDNATNQSNPLDYTQGSDLAESEMYSSYQGSYIFLQIEGLVDTDEDNIADAPFVFRATNDQLLTAVSVQTQSNANEDNILEINLNCNIAKWLENIDLSIVGTQENDGLDNTQMMENTNDFAVFSSTPTTSIQTLVSPQNHIHVDARLSFAPTIYYKFYTGEQLDMTITNLTGTYFIQKFKLSPEGDYYMENDLAAGVYIVIFTSPKGIRQCKKFAIVK